MVKQLSNSEESYLKGLLDAGISYRARDLSLNTITRVNKRSKKIRKLNACNQKKTSRREDRLMMKIVKDHF